ncbi:hypothetical protein RJT34_12001 [Clitoria ternatea]|uniref:Mitochondrial carrier protein n=1 Tax=Clitoria ternatea TaxID=43366 RepID=A0AAN9JKZ1_CLITE
MKAISGLLGGIVEASCLQPIYVIKTRLQLDRSGNYKGIVHCVLQSVFKDPETGKVSNHGQLLSGFGAGVLEAVLIVTPFEWVKENEKKRNSFPSLTGEEGFRGLWAGVALTVMRKGPNQSTMFTAKNAFDVLLWKKHEGDGKVLQPWQSMISRFLAGTVGPIGTGPFDVMKTRLMAQTRVSGGVELKYKGMIHAIRTTFTEEGLALWKGLLLMRIPPGQAIMWAVSDQIIGLYERRYH